MGFKRPDGSTADGDCPDCGAPGSEWSAPAHSTANVVPLPTKAPATPQSPTLNLGAINSRLGFTMNAEFVRRLGIEPAATDKSAKLYTEHQFSLICEALVAHIAAARDQRQVA